MRKITTLIVLIFILTFMVSNLIQADEYDFEGETVSLWGWYDLMEVYQEGGRLEGLLEEAEQKFNVKIEQRDVANADAVETYMARLLAGDSENDIWVVAANSHLWSLASEGALLAVNDIIPDDYFEGFPDSYVRIAEVFSYQGDKYAIGGQLLGPSDFKFIGWNKEIFERENLPDLYDLYESGEWTWEKMRELAEKLTKDTNNDGEIDQWGLGNLPQGDLHFTNNARVTKLDEDGRRVFSFNEPEAIEALEELRKIHQMNIVGDRSNFATGRIAMLPDVIWRINNLGNDLEDDWGIVPFPKGPQMDKYVYQAQTITFQVLPANSSNPEGMVALRKFLSPVEDLQEQMEEGIRDYAQDRTMVEILSNALNNWDGETYVTRGVLDPLWMRGNPLGGAIGQIINGEKTAKVAMDEIAPEMQAKLDDIFN